MDKNEKRIDLLEKKSRTPKLSPKNLKTKNILFAKQKVENTISKWKAIAKKNKSSNEPKVSVNLKKSPRSKRIPRKKVKKEKIISSVRNMKIRINPEKKNTSFANSKKNSPSKKMKNNFRNANKNLSKNKNSNHKKMLSNPTQQQSSSKKKPISRRHKPQRNQTETSREKQLATARAGRSLEKWPGMSKNQFSISKDSYKKKFASPDSLRYGKVMSSRGKVNHNTSTISNLGDGVFRGSNFQSLGGHVFPGMKPPSMGLFNNHFNGNSGGYFGGRGTAGFW